MLSQLLNPKSIAVVGVSETPTKIGSVIYSNIVDNKYSGRIYPVNPKYQELFGRACYPDLAAIPEAVDLVVISVPAAAVPSVLTDAGQKQIPFAIIISAGFGEAGAEGQKLQHQVYEIAEKYHIRVVGPNCLGIINTATNLNASFAAQMPATGNIAFLSQSGAFNTSMLDLAAERNLGFYQFISSGNQVDINELDFVEAWLRDPAVKVIGLYIEQFTAGRALLDLLQKYPRKPIVVLHPGESSAARSAMSSHTGAIATSSLIVRAALSQHGVVQVETLEKLFYSLMMFSRTQLPELSDTVGAGDRVAIVTNAGGPGIMLTDMVAAGGLKVAKFSSSTEAVLREKLPATAAVHNPIDVVGDALADRYDIAIGAALADENVDSLLVLLTPQLVTQIEETAKLLINYSKQSHKPIVPIFSGGQYVQNALQRLDQAQVAAFQYAEEAVASLVNLSSYASYQQPGIAKFHAKKLIKPHTATTLDESAVAMLAKQFSLPLVRQTLVDNLLDAREFAKQVGWPVVLKASSKDVMHKTDIQALYLNIHTENDLGEAFHELQSQIKRLTKQKSPKLLIQEQITGAKELFIGIQRDGDAQVYNTGKGFGHMLVFGTGGIYTEVYHDFSYGLLPLTKDQIVQIVSKPKIAQIIAGSRGNEPLAQDALVEFILQLQNLVMSYPEIKSMDINPLFITSSKVAAADVKVILDN